MEIPPFAKRFYALHICEGVANYPEQKKMLLIREEALRKMDPTMQGVPVKFGGEHLTLKEGEEIAEADNKGGEVEGLVVKSFFNEHDGRHWCEMMVWDPDALAAIERGIGVSNAYVMNSMAPGGEYHATPYDEEVMDGQYDHLLITDKPRYEESKILTPAQFKQYNETRAKALALVTNEKEKSMKFNLFGRKAIEGLSDLTGVEVELPKSKKTLLITNVLNAVDDQMVKEESGDMMANMDHKVKLSENETCKVGELHEKYKAAMEENARLKNENDEWEKVAGGGKAENEEETEEEKKKREDEEKAKNAKDDAEKAEKEKEKAENKKRIQNKVQRLKEGPDRYANSRKDDGEVEQEEVKMTSDKVRKSKA